MKAEINVEKFVAKGIMMFGDSSRGRPYAKDPAVVRFNDHYILYYSIPPGNGIAGWRIGIATGNDLVVWKKVGEMETSQEVEKNGFCAPGAIVLNGNIHLFYQTYGNGKDDAICHAWSDDGFNFTRNPENPIFRPKGAWNCGRAIDADVIGHDGRLLLYFATRNPDMKIQMQGVAAAPISSDFGRTKWIQLNLEGPVLRPELPWETNCIEAAALCRYGNKLYMFYGGGYNNEPQQIGCAVSTDGIVWKRVFDKPFIPNGQPGEWNSSESGHPFAFTDDDGRTFLFYQGNNDHGKSWYLSQTEITWDGDIPYLKRTAK